MKLKNVLLFVSKKSVSFSVTMEEFQKLLSILESLQPFRHEIIDVDQQPEKAEEFKIEVLPTLIVDETRFIGKPDADEILRLLKNA